MIARNVLSITVAVMCSILPSMVGAEDPKLTEQEKSNKETMRWIFEHGVNAQNPDAWDSVLADDYVRHCEAMPPGMQEIKGLESMKGFLTQHFAAFPDWREEIVHLIAEGDKVAAVTRGSGTMTGDMGRMEATNKEGTVHTFMIHRFENGKIVESWITWDNLHFMSQLDLMPVMPLEEAAEK